MLTADAHSKTRTKAHHASAGHGHPRSCSGITRCASLLNLLRESSSAYGILIIPICEQVHQACTSAHLKSLWMVDVQCLTVDS